MRNNVERFRICRESEVRVHAGEESVVRFGWAGLGASLIIGLFFGYLLASMHPF